MSKYCPMCDQITNCTDNCKYCIDELENEKKERETKCQNKGTLATPNHSSVHSMPNTPKTVAITAVLA